MEIIIILRHSFYREFEKNVFRYILIKITTDTLPERPSVQSVRWVRHGKWRHPISSASSSGSILQVISIEIRRLHKCSKIKL
jgi:hypothetical protein